MATKAQVAAAAPPRRSVLAFFLLATVLLVPFWILGALTGWVPLPGLPIAALGAFSPMLAALVLVYRSEKTPGVVALLKRSFDFRRIKARRWYVPILLTMPTVAVVTFGVQRLTGVHVPIPHISVVRTVALCVLGYIAALGEELGWSGYAIDPLQARWGALNAGLMLGLFWAVYHYVGLVQGHRSVVWIAWWTLYTIAARVIMTWIFNNTGRSVFGVALFHMTLNVVWQSYPVSGSFLDYRIVGLTFAVMAVLVVLGWGPSMRGWGFSKWPDLA